MSLSQTLFYLHFHDVCGCLSLILIFSPFLFLSFPFFLSSPVIGNFDPFSAVRMSVNRFNSSFLIASLTVPLLSRRSLQPPQIDATHKRKRRTSSNVFVMIYIWMFLFLSHLSRRYYRSKSERTVWLENEWMRIINRIALQSLTHAHTDITEGQWGISASAGETVSRGISSHASNLLEHGLNHSRWWIDMLPIQKNKLPSPPCRSFSLASFFQHHHQQPTLTLKTCRKGSERETFHGGQAPSLRWCRYLNSRETGDHRLMNFVRFFLKREWMNDRQKEWSGR